jgi:hypothetical protein
MNRIALSLVLVATLCAGCATFNSTAGKLLVSTALTVDAAMQGWAQWVIAGQSNPDQELKVKAAYIKYQASMQIAQAAYQTMVVSNDKTYWDKAAEALTSNRVALLALISSFTPIPGTNTSSK